MVFHAEQTMIPILGINAESGLHLRLIDFLDIVLTLTAMEKNPEKKRSEHPVVVLIISTLLLIPVLILFGGKPYT